jgi:hypothetical protein
MRQKVAIKRVGFLALVVVGMAQRSEAGTITFPNLPTGTEYRLIFVTADSTLPTSGNIADYNTFVTAEADANPELAALGATWTAIASTASANALANIGEPSNAAVYNLDGGELASSTSVLISEAYLYSIGDL